MKRCFKCGETKELDKFYPHPRMADGHLNKCKVCTKTDVKRRYDNEPEKVVALERRRAATPERKAKVLVYQRARRARDPDKNRARQAVGKAIRDGKLSPKPCQVCGTTDKIEAHHDDYSKPLEVRWLCFKHHREVAHGQRVYESSNPASPF